ncbi:MAG: hypothetical protein E7167_04065 [Firmicutes bacterium]|nr:hypothetical protein [Bacillota bacterium]
MESRQILETKVNLYKDIVQRHLLANGVPYVVGKDKYYYSIDDIPYRLTIKDEVITVECLVTSKADHYVFPINRPDILLEHYGFSSKSYDRTEVTHTRVTSENESLFVTAAGLSFDSSTEKDSCASKIVFFSSDLIGEGLYELIHRVRFIDDAVPVGAIQDIPRETTVETAIEDIHTLENEIRSELRIKQTR